MDSHCGADRTISETPPVDLMLLDIRLTDGNSFDIFEQIQVTTPVIFTTAYDEHAIQAFKVNSVDYLLKPVEEDDLLAALRKFEQFRVVQSSRYRLQETGRSIDE